MDDELIQSDLHTPKFSFNNNVYLAKCVKCYDADSIHIVVRVYNKLQRFVCRLAEIDTAEIKSKNIVEKNYAIKSRDYLMKLILNKLIIIKCGDFDKYGRLLVYIYTYEKGQKIPTNELCFENSINNIIVNKKLGYKYDGGTKKKFSEWINMD